MERILITGVGGLLGSNLAYTLRDRFEVVGSYHSNPVNITGCTHVTMDLRQADQVESMVQKIKPQIVIHCAAETRVDYCEDRPEEAFRTNVEGTESLAKAAAQAGSKFLYISTDSVFDGKTGGYQEDAVPGPINSYARSKLQGEQVAQAEISDHLIIRTNIYGWNARPKVSLAEWVLERLESRCEVPAFADIFFSPILVNDLAEYLVQMIAMDLTGIYHVAAIDRCSKLDFAMMVCQIFDKDPDLIVASSSEDAGLKAPRPKNTFLDVTKISQALGKPMPSVAEGLRRFRSLKESGYVQGLRSILPEVEVGR